VRGDQIRVQVPSKQGLCSFCDRLWQGWPLSGVTVSLRLQEDVTTRLEEANSQHANSVSGSMDFLL
jgi:hypothetical protein